MLKKRPQTPDHLHHRHKILCALTDPRTFSAATQQIQGLNRTQLERLVQQGYIEKFTAQVKGIKNTYYKTTEVGQHWVAAHTPIIGAA